GSDVLREEHGSHGEPATQRFRKAEEVRPNPGRLVGEEGAGPSEPALHLVEDERDSALPGPAAHLLDHRVRKEADSALTLNRLEDDRRRANRIEGLRHSLE